MSKSNNKKQPAKQIESTAVEAKPAVKAEVKKQVNIENKEVIVEAPSKVEQKPATINRNKPRHRRPVKKATAPVAKQEKQVEKKLNWFQRTFNKILKWL